MTLTRTPTVCYCWAPSMHGSLSPAGVQSSHCSGVQSSHCSHSLPFLLPPSHLVPPIPSTTARRPLKTQVRLCHVLLCRVSSGDGLQDPDTNILGAQIPSIKNVAFANDYTSSEHFKSSLDYLLPNTMPIAVIPDCLGNHFSGFLFQVFSICGWLNLQTGNPQIGRLL